jgi:hypothetical protein
MNPVTEEQKHVLSELGYLGDLPETRQRATQLIQRLRTKKEVYNHVARRINRKKEVATNSQYAMLDSLGIEYDEPLTKSEASRLIDERNNQVVEDTPTQPQLDLIVKKGHKGPMPQTKKEASIIIDELIARGTSKTKDEVNSEALNYAHIWVNGTSNTNDTWVNVVLLQRIYHYFPVEPQYFTDARGDTWGVYGTFIQRNPDFCEFMKNYTQWLIRNHTWVTTNKAKMLDPVCQLFRDYLSTREHNYPKAMQHYLDEWLAAGMPLHQPKIQEPIVYVDVMDDDLDDDEEFNLENDIDPRENPMLVQFRKALQDLKGGQLKD